MAKRMFRVDLSPAARDFQPKATEPGLGMIDPNGANYKILRKWLGSLIAEPEWVSDTSVSFYIRHEDTGRMEEIDVHPVVQKDLEGKSKLKEEADAIGVKLRKIKPESTTEQTLHRILSDSYKKLTANLEQTPYDCFFFKYREGKGPWQLVFCWGYQRSDDEPGKALICSNGNCGQLFVRRPGTKPLCPGCQKLFRRKKTGILGALPVPLPVAVLLLLMLGYMLWSIRPQLVVTPGPWDGAPGARQKFTVVHSSWFFWSEDVTDRTEIKTHDVRVVEVDSHNREAKALKIGNTKLTFNFRNFYTDVTATIGAIKPPDALVIRPDKVKLGPGSTARLKVFGTYKDGGEIELTDVVDFEVANESLVHASFHDGALLEGKLAQGDTQVVAKYLADPKSNKPLSATTKVTVVDADYVELEVKVEPTELVVNQSGDLSIDALDKDKERYSFLESSLLQMLIDPTERGTAKRDKLLALTPGYGEVEAEITVKGKTLAASCKFNVTGESGEGPLAVYPESLALRMYEPYPLAVSSSDTETPITSSSEDESVAVISNDGKYTVVGRKVGSTTIIVKQGEIAKLVPVTVSKVTYQDIAVNPSTIVLRVGESTSIRVFGTTADGEQVLIDGAQLTFSQQPLAENVQLDRSTLTLTGRAPTSSPQALAIRFGDSLTAAADVSVLGNSLLADTGEDTWGVYGPLNRQGTSIVGTPVASTAMTSVLGNGLSYSRDGSLIVGDNLAAGSVLREAGLRPGMAITGIDGVGLYQTSPGDVRSFLANHPITDSSVIQYYDPEADAYNTFVPREMTEGKNFTVYLLNMTYLSINETNFTAEARIRFLVAADYRIVDSEGNEIIPFTPVGPKSIEDLRLGEVSRTPNDEYKILVERRIGDEIESFPLNYTLDAGQAVDIGATDLPGFDVGGFDSPGLDTPGFSDDSINTNGDTPPGFGDEKIPSAGGDPDPGSSPPEGGVPPEG
ncbi:MAG: hypothetical protein N2C14_02680, partial [Planctomycetales bacterium]